MTKINILCLTLILLLVVECHLRQTQLSSVSPADGEKDDAYDILDADLDKLIKIMTLSKGNTVNVTSMIVDIVDLALGTGASLLPNTPPADGRGLGAFCQAPSPRLSPGAGAGLGFEVGVPGLL
uniref:Uncharacterized protein n=1 Tax=Panagrolaimus davidi TaxID=227884 RepID=A0A914P5N8_9BILA